MRNGGHHGVEIDSATNTNIPSNVLVYAPDGLHLRDHVRAYMTVNGCRHNCRGRYGVPSLAMYKVNSIDDACFLDDEAR
jgi:hypothetical protein